MAGKSSPRDFSEKGQLQDSQAAVLEALTRMIPVLKAQLELIDDVDIADDRTSVKRTSFSAANSGKNTIGFTETDALTTNNSLLYLLAMHIRGLDARYLQSKLKKLDFTSFLTGIQKAGNVDIRDDLIFAKTGARKTDIRTSGIRRLSFAATTFNDNSSILNKNKLLEMTDLQYLFSMNAYYVPYLELNEGRSMYQTFFGVVVNTLLEGDALQTPAGFGFHILQEALYPIQMITEYTVSLIECIVEIVMVINTRVKTATINIEQRLNLQELRNPTLEHLLECFSSGNKIFLGFKKRKILSAIKETDAISPKGDGSLRGKDVRWSSKDTDREKERERERQAINWSSKIRDYHQALSDAVDSYKSQCEVFSEQLQDLKKRASEFRSSVPDMNAAETAVNETQSPRDLSAQEARMVKIESYLAEAFVYVAHFNSFLTELSSPDGTYRIFFERGVEFLELLNQLQEKYPVRYGNIITPRVGRAGVKRSSDRYGRRGSSSSPRSAASSDNEASPRTTSGDDVIDRKTPEVESLPKSGDYKSMFSRVLGSMFK